eukprot:222582-Chlamydomonas_euryale.AAC.3
MSDESEVEQLLFAEGVAGMAGVVGRPHSMWQERALQRLCVRGQVAALRPVLTFLAGWGCQGVAQDRAQWRFLCDNA